jgi:hypothetical protein
VHVGIYMQDMPPKLDASSILHSCSQWWRRHAGRPRLVDHGANGGHNMRPAAAPRWSLQATSCRSTTETTCCWRWW